MDAREASRKDDLPYEEALIADALATLYADADAAQRRDEIVERLGILRLPPFLTIG